MSDHVILCEVADGIATVTLNRPQALNSFTREMHQSLWRAFDQAEANPAVRALVLTGAGRGFCAGLDLSELDFTPGPGLLERADPGPVIHDAFNPTTRRLQAMRMPVIAAVNGVAAGAGASVAMACDIAIASPNASFIQAFSKIGLIPDAGSSWLLVERLGMPRALALALWRRLSCWWKTPPKRWLAPSLMPPRLPPLPLPAALPVPEWPEAFQELPLPEKVLFYSEDKAADLRAETIEEWRRALSK